MERRSRPTTTPNSRTCIRDVESLDGIGSLLDKNAATRTDRDEFAGSGLQPEAGDQDSWNPDADRSYTSVEAEMPPSDT